MAEWDPRDTTANGEEEEDSDPSELSSSTLFTPPRK